MPRQLPPLKALRAFEVAARTGSFTAAARELRVSQGAVSRHIAVLESVLGVTLFDRSHREVRLTRDGEKYAISIGLAFDQVEHATQHLWRGQNQRSLRIKLYPTMATRWLVTRIGNFHALRPNIDVQITTSNHPAALDREDIDFTIEHGDIRQEGSRYDYMFDIELLPVCSPSILNGSRPIREPRNLLEQVLLHSLLRMSYWKRWFQSVGIHDAIADNGLKFGNSSLVYQAAINGVGVAMADPRFVADELASGRLVPPFQQRLMTGRAYYLVGREQDAQEPSVTAFRDWVLSECRGEATGIRPKKPLANTSNPRAFARETIANSRVME
jgi:LysR family glycine cleavage system transcriptional activator